MLAWQQHLKANSTSADLELATSHALIKPVVDDDKYHLNMACACQSNSTAKMSLASERFKFARQAEQVEGALCDNRAFKAALALMLCNAASARM